ncbi:MAG TPA: hypothetical protein VKV19_08045 [Ktedonobacteraceae bacterium]|nr:hypothetical protein [Ktedonobacteraceae bacterium]
MFLVPLLLLVAFISPVHASSSKRAVVRHPSDDPTAVNVYLPIGALQQQFQQGISQTLPEQFNQSLAQQTKSLPPDIRSLVSQLVGELLQPSATLSQLTPQQEGLVASIRISLFPHDPHPSGFSMLLVFNKINATSAEVDVKAVPGQPAPPAMGNLDTFNVSLGQLNTIGPTPNCGVSALKMNISTPQGQQSTSGQGGGGQAGGFPLFIEVPSAAFQQGAAAAGDMQLAAGFSVQNIQISLQGNGMVVTTQIAFAGLGVGSTMTTIQLSASNGKLIGTVTGTQVNVVGLSFPLDSFDQDIQQMINQELSSMMGNMLYVTSVHFGPTAAIPCAAPGNMLLGGFAAGF